MEKRKLNSLPYTEWVQIFRPNGKGNITIMELSPSLEPGKIIHKVEFEEVYCDLRNEEILPTKEDGSENIIYFDDWGAYCEKCAHEITGEYSDENTQ